MHVLWKPSLAVLGFSVAVSGTAGAQEMFSVNLWGGGRFNNDISDWVVDDNGTLIPDETSLDTIQLEGASAGAWATTQWDNIYLGAPLGVTTTPATTINGSSGSTATFEMFNRRNNGPHGWVNVRDDSDVLAGNEGNAQLLGSGVNSTEFDSANGSGNPFGYQIGDYEIRDIPFATYDVAVYFHVTAGQSYSGIGNIRINGDVVRPTDPLDWKNSVIADGALDMSGATNFTMPTTADGFEPDGTLDLIDPGNADLVGNYIVFSGLTGSTFNMQTWGEAFTHLGAAGFQIMDAASVTPGDTDGDGDIDDSDLGTSFANYTGPVGAAGNKTAAEGDTDGDGDVDDSDLGTSFSGYTGPQGPAAVPEPTSLALLGLGGLLIARRRRA